MKQRAKVNFFAKITRFFKGAYCQNSKKEASNVNNPPKTKEFERCVMCGALTCIPVSMPIDLRENYAIGCGQLCAECAKKHKTTKRENG